LNGFNIDGNLQGSTDITGFDRILQVPLAGGDTLNQLAKLQSDSATLIDVGFVISHGFAWSISKIACDSVTSIDVGFVILESAAWLFRK
jgi:hypothetical protein